MLEKGEISRKAERALHSTTHVWRVDSRLALGDTGRKSVACGAVSGLGGATEQ